MSRLPATASAALRAGRSGCAAAAAWAPCAMTERGCSTAKMLPIRSCRGEKLPKLGQCRERGRAALRLLRRLGGDGLARADHHVGQQPPDAMMHALDGSVVAHRIEIEDAFVVPILHDARAVEQGHA